MSTAFQMHRVNWVGCPKCKYRFYVGIQLLLIKEVPAICPKCRHEFDPKEHIQSAISQTSVDERWV